MLTRPRSWLPPQLVDLYDHARFEYHTFKGRLFAKKLRRYPQLSYLHVGCGSVHLPGFLNTDCFLNRDVDLPIDIRFPLPLESSAWRGIYAHHSLEHIPYRDACAFLREAYRILLPGGRIRIVVPDGGKIVDLYARHRERADSEIFQFHPLQHRNPEHRTAMEILNHVFRDEKFNPHYFAWDYETLFFRLHEAGFASVIRVGVGASEDPRLAHLDNPGWENHSLYVEAIK